ncbi:MAG: hypothetical protein ACTSPZ_02820 [Promethearchaeota archaeon]
MNDRKQKFKCIKSYYYYVETKYRLRPNFFIAPYRKDTSVYCPACGHTMDLIPHTPKKKKPIFQCPRCNTVIPRQFFRLSDLK